MSYCPLVGITGMGGQLMHNCYNILPQKENLRYYSVNFSQKHCFISNITNKNSKIRIKIYKRYKATYISAFCMQTTAHANLCNSPPERSSTFRSFRWVKSTKNIEEALCSMLKFYFTSSWQNVYCTSFWVWMMSQLKTALTQNVNMKITKKFSH